MGQVLDPSSSSYCSITPQHSLCLHTAPSSYCGQVYYRGLSEVSPAPATLSCDTDTGPVQREKQEALDEHNRLRSLVAGGGTAQPPAADMRELVWDEELARVAQVSSCSNCV